MVVEYVGFEKRNKTRKHHYFKCICDCGNEKICTLFDLQHEKVKSCGCLHKKKSAERMKKQATIDGRSKSKYYSRYYGMMNRCYNKNNDCYENYGGRGIQVCDEWLQDPFAFYKWCEDNKINGKEITIDRIDFNGDYCPENCRGADKYIQANNTTKNFYIEYNSQIKSLKDWCRELNLKYKMVLNRLRKQGLTFEEAILNAEIKDGDENCQVI